MKRALAFLTLFGRSELPSRTTLSWFPLVGALVGLVLGVFWWLVAHVLDRASAAALVVAADLVLTGGLHFDGLADAGDGLLAPLSRERRLAAMADPAVGAFGVLCVVAVLLSRFAALSGLAPQIVMLTGLWCASRTAMVAMIELLPYARTTGLVTSFLAHSPTRRQRVTQRLSVVVGLAGSLALVLVARGAHGLVALVGELLAMGLVGTLSWRRIGGFTGDVLGAAGVLGETVGLLLLVAR